MSELMLKRSEDVSKVNEELSRLNTKIKEGREILLITDDTEEFIKKKNEIELDEQLVTVLKRKLKNVSTPLDNEEFNSLKNEAVNAYRELMDEYGVKINKELSSLLVLMREYTDKSNYVSGMLSDLEDLNGRATGMRKQLKGVELAGANLEDKEGWFKFFVMWYYQRLSQIEMLKSHGIN